MPVEPIETAGTALPTCPACGYEDSAYFEYRDGEEYVCGRCGDPFAVELEMVAYFTTRPVGRP